MRLSLKQLKSLSVETVSGVALGHVHDVVLQTDGQLVAQYIVKSSMIRGNEYVVSRDQVVRFEEKRLVVDDTVSATNESPDTKSSTIRISPKPIAMRE